MLSGDNKNQLSDEGKPVYILAEMAASHEGSQEIAALIIDAVAEAGADGILFQIIDPDSYIVPSDEDYENIKKFIMERKEWEELISKAVSLGLEIWANVYDLASLDMCKNSDIKGFKLHSSNLENEKLLREVVKLHKEMHLSIGGMRKEEIKEVISIIYSINQDAKVCLMYGLQNFPTNPEGINLNFISELSKELSLPFGYQDHSEPTSPASTFMPVLAVAMGASVIEKHITSNRQLKGLDYEAALNPDEFVGFVRDIRLAKSIIDKAPEALSEDELIYRQYKSLMKVVARTKINAGDTFTEDNLTAMRAKKGEISGKNLKDLLSRKSKAGYRQYEPIKENELI